EAPPSMLIPLLILALFAIVSGYVGVPPILGGGNYIQQFLTPAANEAASESQGTSNVEAILMATSTGAALLGLGFAYLFYVAKPGLPQKLVTRFHALYSIIVNKYYVDELNDTVIVWPIVTVSREFLWKFVDNVMIDGAINGLAYVVRGAGAGLRHMQ